MTLPPLSRVENPRTASGGLPLESAVLLLCAMGLLGAARAPAFPRAFLIAFAVTACLRLTLGRDGRAFLPRKALRAFVLTVTAFSLAWLFQRLASRSTDPLSALVSVIAVFQGLVLLSRRTVFGAFLLILFSSVHAAGVAFQFQDRTGLLWVLGYVALLVWTLVLFERRATYDRKEGGSGAVVLIRPSDAPALPLRSVLGATLLLILLGFPLGAALYLAAPRLSKDDPDTAGSAGSKAQEYADENVPGKEVRVGPETATAAFTGPGKGVPLGSVAEIKKDITPWFRVSLEKPRNVRDFPPTVVLRDNVMDHCHVDGLWTDTLSADMRPRLYMDADDGIRDGWVPLGHKDDSRAGVTLRIEMLRGGQRRLYLQPDEVRLKLLRNGRSRSGFAVFESRNKTLALDYQLKAEDVILQRYVHPVRAGMRLTGRRSDRSVSLLDSYLQVPRACRAPLGARARKVVGAETDPWRRAQLLEAWLNSDVFEYTLKAPPLRRSNPVVDFVERTRSGSCSYYATALTLMLRTLGHPARFARGFWGGDRLEESPSVMLRGYHYHAWTELYLDGVGWVALNPTPPDRAAADGATRTAAQALASEDGAGFSLLFYDGEQWARLWSSTGSWLGTRILRPIGRLFGADAGYLGYPLLLLLLWLLRRRKERVRLRRMISPDGHPVPGGDYGRALLLLARKGLRRRPSWTAREFRTYVARRFPRTAQPLGILTQRYEWERFGGREPIRSSPAGESALARLEAALSTPDAG